MTKHLTSDEIQQRQEQENKLKELARDKIRPPTWMNKNAKKIFRQIVIDLEGIDLLANADVMPLAILADAFDKYIIITKELDESSLIVEYTNKAGATNIVENPLVRTQHKYAELIKKYSNEFGLTVAARLKLIHVNSTDDGDEFDDDF